MSRKPNKKKKRKPKVSPQPKISKQSLWMAMGVFLFGFLLYANTINHDFVLDDDIVTRKNAFVQKGFAGLPAIFSHGYLYGFNQKNDQSYRPLVLANMAIETQIFGAKPSIHHFFNVLFYAISGVILLFFLFNVFKNKSPLIPLAITLLFLAHPIHTEVVANIKSRDEVLSFMFVVTSLWALMKYVGSNDKKFLFISLGAYFLCILSKETGLAMLGLIPFTLYFFSNKSNQKILVTTVYFVGIAALYFVIRASVMDSMTFEEGMSPINNSLMMAQSGGEKFATNISIMGRYLKLLVLPYPLSYDYSYNQIPIIGFSDWKFILSFFAYVGLAVLAIWGLFTKRVFSYGIILYVIMLLLVSNFLTMVGAPMAERFVYGSTLGFSIILGYYVVNLFGDENSKSINYKSIPIAVFSLILIVYSVVTINRNMVWKNPESLYTSGLISAPNSARAQNHYASYLRDIVEADPTNPNSQAIAVKAEQAYLRALEIYPEYTEASYNLGVLYFTTNQPDKALSAYENTLSVSPTHTNALNNTGVIYFNRGDYQNALSHWNRVIEVDAKNSQALGNLGALNQNSGNLQQAISYYNQALEIDPYNVNILNNIIKAYNTLGQPENAVEFQNRLSQMNR